MDSLNCLNKDALRVQVSLWTTDVLIKNMLYAQNNIIQKACILELNRRIPTPATNERKDDGTPQEATENS